MMFVLFGFATELVACPDDDRILLISCDTPFTVALENLAETQLVPNALTGELMVTGAYSSADRFGVEGLAIELGKLISNRFQSWDGIAVITSTGSISIHHVERVSINDRFFNLRKPDEFQLFVKFAQTERLSVIQSHLLVTDGVVDVRDRDNQPRFWRRVLFVTDEGDVGLFDTGIDALTLFETANELYEIDALMALNLDMGAYDYCAKGVARCGLLRRENTRILTNILRFSPIN